MEQHRHAIKPQSIAIPLALTGELEQFRNIIRDGGKVSVFGMPFYNRVLAVAAVARQFDGSKKGDGTLLYVCADYPSSKAAYEELECIFGEDAVLLAYKDDVLTYAKSQAGQNSVLRMLALQKIAKNQARIVVTTPEALVQLYPDREDFVACELSLKVGDEVQQGDVIKKLLRAGYKREAQVVNMGQFSLRGDLLDIWAIGETHGYRIEFFGDEVDTIRKFDIGEQVTVSEVGEITVCPYTEVFYSEQQAESTAMQLTSALKKVPSAPERLSGMVSDLVMRLKGGDSGLTLSYILPLVKNNTAGEFICPTSVIYDDAKQVYDTVKVIYTEHYSRCKSLIEQAEALPFIVNQFIDELSAFKMQVVSLAAFHKVTTANRIFTPTAVLNRKSTALPDYTKDRAMMSDDAEMWAKRGYNVTIYCTTENVRQNISEFLTSRRVAHGFEGSGARIILLCQKLNHGAAFHEEKTVLIGYYDFTVKSAKKTLKRSKKDVFVAPQVGDYVVHTIHGIGLCEEIKRMEMGGNSRDYIVIKYRDGDKLFVPIENMDSLSKLISGEQHPKLSKIGGADFAKIKERVKASVKAMAIDLLALYANRAQCNGHKYSSDHELLNAFASDFPYRETDDQLVAIDEGLNDLMSGKVMDRLLCGDVGYGKTEVALRLAFKVIAEGKQVAFISPTTILANQHYQTAQKRMNPFGVNVRALTRFQNAAQTNAALADLASGKAEIAVGTHRVLSKDVIFKDLGLLILDEEQRFGVADKERIKKLKLNVNVLSLSATPIPRTLHMSMVGIRDISVLDTPPAERLPVQTYVTEYSETLAADVINREVNRDGQVFIVYNRVANIEQFALSVQRLVPDVKILVAHGQMNETVLENVINGFVKGDGDVLIASTIIENGIDIPRANTMIVVDSDKLGLSQLYQLRGRVGRSNRVSYVYFTFDGSKILTETAYKRLEAITEFTEFGSGFKIAMRDLEIRGAGNILGREQHGHIEKVGYDMYCKLLAEAVSELSGESQEYKPVADLKVVTDFNAFVPQSYVPDSEWRVRLYSRIATLKSMEESNALGKDLADIYGKLPDSVSNLMTIGLVKNLAAAIGANNVILKKRECSIGITKLKDVPEHVLKRLSLTPNVRLNADSSRIIFEGGAASRKVMINFLLNCHKN